MSGLGLAFWVESLGILPPYLNSPLRTVSTRGGTSQGLGLVASVARS